MARNKQELHPVLTGARLSKEIAHIPRRRRERAFVKIADELWLPIDTEQSLETLSVAYSRLYPTGVLTGWSAAALHGVDAPREAVPELCVGPHGRVRAGLRLRRYTMPDRAVMSVRGVPVTTPTWTAFDLARFNTHVDGVLALESLYRKGFTPALMQQTIDSLAGTWGVARARRVLADSDVRS
jgi:hypothetical protein